MKKDYGSDKLSALDAKFEAQKIAFGPIMFQAARLLRELGILESLRTRNSNGLSPEEVAEKTNVSLYGVKVLLDAGLSMGVVRMVDEKFILTKTGFFVLSDTLQKPILILFGMFVTNHSITSKNQLRKGSLQDLRNWVTGKLYILH